MGARVAVEQPAGIPQRPGHQRHCCSREGPIARGRLGDGLKAGGCRTPRRRRWRPEVADVNRCGCYASRRIDNKFWLEPRCAGAESRRLCARVVHHTGNRAPCQQSRGHRPSGATGRSRTGPRTGQRARSPTRAGARGEDRRVGTRRPRTAGDDIDASRSLRRSLRWPRHWPRQFGNGGDHSQR